MHELSETARQRLRYVFVGTLTLVTLGNGAAWSTYQRRMDPPLRVRAHTDLASVCRDNSAPWVREALAFYYELGALAAGGRLTIADAAMAEEAWLVGAASGLEAHVDLSLASLADAAVAGLAARADATRPYLGRTLYFIAGPVGSEYVALPAQPPAPSLFVIPRASYEAARVATRAEGSAP